MIRMLGPWGFLPIVAPLFAFIAARLGAAALGRTGTSRADRAVAGVVLSIAGAIVTVRCLSFVHAVAGPALVAALASAAFALAVTTSPRSREVIRFRPDAGLAAVYLVALAGLGIAVVAALWLPVWQWDSLGYHLPFVHFTLAARSVDGVPPDLVYISSYPHAVELFFVALRACLPDDRLIDLGQVPLGIAGAVVTAALARRAGASREAAVGAGALWLLVPAVFLQLPTNYVDVGTATFFLASIYLVTGPVRTSTSLVAGVSLGMLLGSKPSAPVPVAVLLLVLVVRAWRDRQLPLAASAVALSGLLGCETYVVNLLRHHNPVWPVTVDVGPFHFPGPQTMADLLASGAAAPHLTGPMPWRIARSFLALGSPPVFDMRVGGYGPVFLLALPAAVWWLWRARDAALTVACVCPMISPDPAIARYVMAFPAVMIALAAAATVDLAAPRRRGVAALAALLGVWQLVYAYPGLTGEGPSLGVYRTLSEEQRALAVGADGPPTAVAAARARVGDGEAFAFDENMDLCDQAWDPHRDYRVVVLPPTLAGESLAGTLERDTVRVMAVGDQGPAGVWALTHPLQFERVSALPSCRKGTCSIFARR